MNKILIFLLGVAIGGIGTYYVVKKKNDAEWDKFLADHDDKKEDKKTFSDQLKNRRKEIEVEECSEDELVEYYISQLRDLGVGIEYGEDYPEEEVNPTDEDDSPEDDGVSIYPIQKILYDAGKSEYSKEHLAYYRGDDTFVDLDTGEPIDKISQYLGDAFDKDADVKESYVRNEALESDFEVVIFETSFGAASGESDDEDDYVPGDMADRPKRK